MVYQPRSPRQPSGSSSAVRADVAAQELVRAAEAELRGDAADVADALAVVEHLAQGLQPPAVHEHHAVHELHAVAVARVEHLAHVVGGDADRLLHEHVLSGARRPDHPRLANAGRQRDVDRIDVGAARAARRSRRRRRDRRCGQAAGKRRRTRGCARAAAGDRDERALPARRIACQFLRAMSAVPRIPQRQTAALVMRSPRPSSPRPSGRGDEACLA